MLKRLNLELEIFQTRFHPGYDILYEGQLGILFFRYYPTHRMGIMSCGLEIFFFFLLLHGGALYHCNAKGLFSGIKQVYNDILMSRLYLPFPHCPRNPPLYTSFKSDANHYPAQHDKELPTFSLSMMLSGREPGSSNSGRFKIHFL